MSSAYSQSSSSAKLLESRFSEWHSVDPSRSTVIGHVGLIHLHSNINGRFKLQEGKARKKVERKLRGFVVQFESEDVRVLLSSAKGEQYQYKFPAVQLRAAGITVENQPFELQEIKTIDADDGLPVYGIKFRPMAPAASAQLVGLDSDEEFRSKRQKTLAYFSEKKKNASA